jgi:3-oxoacid CoA-transferase subunit B
LPKRKNPVITGIYCDLPLTGAGVVDRIISDLAVFDVVDGGLVLRAVAPGASVDQLRAVTGAEFVVDLDETVAPAAAAVSLSARVSA